MGCRARPLAQGGNTMKASRELIEEIDQTISVTPTLWWLGHAGFVVKFANITFYIDPHLSRADSPLQGSEVKHADMILATHAHPGHLDGRSIAAMLEGSKGAKVILPKSAVETAFAQGIPYARMTTTDSDLRVEYFKGNLYGRIYAVPSAHPRLDWTATGGYPYLGYLIRFGRWTIYHAGDSVNYEALANRLRPYNVNVAVLPVGGKNFSANAAARLTEDIGATWLVPMHYPPDDESEFIAHMLGQRPEQPFKVFQVGEKWTVPEE
jgi:L-ascorbate metabolism protein UlaG (beta-lactamase superfamily)